MNALERLRAKAEDAKLPALLVSDAENAGWLTGFTGSNAHVILTPDKGVFITDSRYTIQAREQVQGLEVVTYSSPREMSEVVAEQVKDLGIKRIGFEGKTMTFEQFDKLRSHLNGTELVPAPDLVGDLRLVKSADEIESLRKACKLADACFDHVRRLIQPAVSEWDIGLEIEFFFRRNMADLSFAPIVVSGHRSAMPHARASEKKLEHGDFVTLDFGCKLDGYCSDITRTVVVGEASQRHRFIYGKVLEAQLAALDAIKPGAIAKDVDGVARGLLAEADLAQYFGHGLGHGLGRNVHDGGRLGQTSSTVLEPGQVWTVEPGVYIDGFGGVRIEDDVVVTETGVEILTHSPKELLILPQA